MMDQLKHLDKIYIKTMEAIMQEEITKDLNRKLTFISSRRLHIDR